MARMDELALDCLLGYRPVRGTVKLGEGPYSDRGLWAGKVGAEQNRRSSRRALRHHYQSARPAAIVSLQASFVSSSKRIVYKTPTRASAPDPEG